MPTPIHNHFNHVQLPLLKAPSRLKHFTGLDLWKNFLFGTLIHGSYPTPSSLCMHELSYEVAFSAYVCMLSHLYSKFVWINSEWQMCACVCVDTICYLLCCLTDRMWYTMSNRPAYIIRSFKSCFSHHHLHFERCLSKWWHNHTRTSMCHTQVANYL